MPDANEQARLMRMSREWANALAGRNVDEIVSYWDEHALVMPPDQPALVGHPALREYVASSLAIRGFSVTWEPELAFVSEDRTTAYLIERSRYTFPDASGSIRTQFGKTVTIWRKNSEGRWKCVVDIWNGHPTDQVLPPTPTA